LNRRLQIGLAGKSSQAESAILGSLENKSAQILQSMVSKKLLTFSFANIFTEKQRVVFGAENNFKKRVSRAIFLRGNVNEKLDYFERRK
jgi:hypothetical protein